jgi:hypothetical protein
MNMDNPSTCNDDWSLSKPQPNDLLDSLIDQVKTILDNLTSEGSDILELLEKFDLQDNLKISINLSTPKKIQEGQLLIQEGKSLIKNNQFQLQETCRAWDPVLGKFVKVPCDIF